VNERVYKNVLVGPLFILKI